MQLLDTTKKKMEVVKFIVRVIAQALQCLEDSEAGTDLHTFFQSQPLLI